MKHAPNPAYPTRRFKIHDGWYLELLPLTLERARIVHTNGFLVDEFW